MSNDQMTDRSKIIEVMGSGICGPGTTCEACRNSAERALSALHDKGLAVVPVEPTPAMLEAGANELVAYSDTSALSDASEAWAAMLAASNSTKEESDE